jgi:ketol-acid reductoisomerase
MDYMYAACSTTARRGALDWAPEFEKANRPVFEALYKSVRDGTETRKSLEFNSRHVPRGPGEGAQGDRRAGDLARGQDCPLPPSRLQVSGRLGQD